MSELVTGPGGPGAPPMGGGPGGGPGGMGGPPGMGGPGGQMQRESIAFPPSISKNYETPGFLLDIAKKIPKGQKKLKPKKTQADNLKTQYFAN